MKKLLTLSILFAAVAFSSCGSMSGLTPEERAQKKAQEHKLDSLAGVQARKAVKAQSFVVMADEMLVGKYNIPANGLDDHTNFVYVDKDQGVIQTAFGGGYLGPNGLGGLTVDGTVSQYTVTENAKRGETYVHYYINGMSVNASVDITIVKNSNAVTAVVMPTLWNDQLVIYGKIVPIDNGDGNLFKGEVVAPIRSRL